jgi:hypothetical protein
MLDPDWLRIGSDIVGPNPTAGPTFNAAFSLDGVSVPAPIAGAVLGWWRRRRKTA